MSDIDVRPESIHLAAHKVEGAGQDWGESIGKLKSDMNSAGDPYGGDELGNALREIYQIIGPTALTYFTETGFCLIETAHAMDELAAAYTVVERDNTAQVAKVGKIIHSLGDI